MSNQALRPWVQVLVLLLICAVDSNSIFQTEERIVVTNQAMGARCAVAADFDGDGLMDLVSASSNDNAVSWFRNEGLDANGGVQFSIKKQISWASLGSRIVAVADVNGDGHVDVVGASYYDRSLRWFENDGLGEFTPHLISSGVDQGQGVAIADLDNDGDADIISASSGDNTIAVFRNVDQGQFCEIKEIVDDQALGARTVVAADLNGDGWIDLAAASKDDDSVTWYPNDGTGHFPTKLVISRGEESLGAYSLVAVDMDQDGDTDLIVASNGNDQVSLYRNDGHGNFTKTLIYENADFVLSVTAVDFDRDGDMDVASASFFDGYIRWYENVDGKGYEWKNHTVYVGTQGHYVSHADMDGDGDDDLIAVTHAENTVAVFLAHTECDDQMEGASCCHKGTEWNGISCEPCRNGTYGVGHGVTARCEKCPTACTIPGFNVVPATCAGITGCADQDASIAQCSCPIHHVKDPETDACAECPAGQFRPNVLEERTSNSIGNYTEWELQQGVCALPEQEEQLNQIDAIVPFGLTLMSIALGLSLFFGVWTTYYRRQRIVRASQPAFLIMICVGTAIMSSAIVPFGIDDKNFSDEACSIACMSAPWLICIGFTIAFSALFSKLYRINQVMRAANRKIKVTETDVLKPFAVLLTVNVVVLVVWTIRDPLEWLRQPLQDGQPWETYGTCHFNGTASIVCAVLLAFFALSALILACVQGYMARSISDEYSESKFIGIAVICWLQVLIIGGPLVFFMSGNATAEYFLKTGIIFVVSASLLLLVFVPKMIQKSKAPVRKKRSVCVSGVSFNESDLENFNNSATSLNLSGKTWNRSGSFTLNRSGSFELGRESQSSAGNGLAIVSPQLEIADLQAQVFDLKSENRRLNKKNHSLNERLRQVYNTVHPSDLGLSDSKLGERSRLISFAVDELQMALGRDCNSNGDTSDPSLSSAIYPNGEVDEEINETTKEVEAVTDDPVDMNPTPFEGEQEMSA